MHPLLKKILDPPLKPTAMPHGYVMLTCPNKLGETAGHGCHYPGDMAVRMFEVLVRPWVFVGWCPYVTRFIFVICMVYGRTPFGTFTSMEISPCYPQKRAHRFQMADHCIRQGDLQVNWLVLSELTTRPNAWETNASLR